MEQCSSYSRGSCVSACDDLENNFRIAVFLSQTVSNKRALENKIPSVRTFHLS